MRLSFFTWMMLFGAWIASAQSSHCLSDRYSQDALFDSTDIQIIPNVHFATSMRWPSTTMDSLEMDIYMPDPNVDPLTERPLIVMTHGGSFAAGTRAVMAYYCMEMARRGFVTATISYRLGWNCNVAAGDPCFICQGEAWRAKVATYRAVQDNRAAIRHLVHNASSLGIDTSFIVLQGESAGSITSLNSAFWDQTEADAWCPNCTSEVGLLDTAGNNLTESYSIKGVINNCGAVSHLDVMDGHQIPVVNFHNNPDCLVPYGTSPVMNCLGCAAFYWAAGSNSIQARLNTNGVCTQRHAKSAILPDHCTYGAIPIIKKSACFLKGILCENCVSVNSDNNFGIPDCTAGVAVAIDEQDNSEWVRITGNRLVFTTSASITSVGIYDVSMRLLDEVQVSGARKVQLPASIQGCVFIRVDAEELPTKMLKWCQFN